MCLQDIVYCIRPYLFSLRNHQSWTEKLCEHLQFSLDVSLWFSHSTKIILSGEFCIVDCINSILYWCIVYWQWWMFYQNLLTILVSLIARLEASAHSLASAILTLISSLIVVENCSADFCSKRSTSSLHSCCVSLAFIFVTACVLSSVIDHEWF